IRGKVQHFNTFREVLLIASEWMVKREELSMFVERRIFSTLSQPYEHQSCLAYWARELSVNTPAAEYPIRRQVMQGIMVLLALLKYPFYPLFNFDNGMNLI